MDYIVHGVTKSWTQLSALHFPLKPYLVDLSFLASSFLPLSIFLFFFFLNQAVGLTSFYLVLSPCLLIFHFLQETDCPHWREFSEGSICSMGNSFSVHAKLLHSCLTLCDSMDSSLPDSPSMGILQTRILK